MFTLMFLFTISKRLIDSIYSTNSVFLPQSGVLGPFLDHLSIFAEQHMQLSQKPNSSQLTCPKILQLQLTNAGHKPVHMNYHQ